MYPFEYHKPADLADARRIFDAADDGLYIAGGMTVIPTLKQRLASPSDVIDLSGIRAMGSISADDGKVIIGAMTRHSDVANSPVLHEHIPALAALAGEIGDPAVRNRGTIGGSIANSDPAADYPAALLGLGATVVTTAREIAADDFFLDLFETALDEGEIITAIHFPVPKAAAYAKFSNPASRYAVVGVFVARNIAGSDVAVRVGVTGAGPCAFRQMDMEAALAQEFSPWALDDVFISADGLNEDIHASSDYRAHLVKVMAARAVDAAS